MKTKSDWRDRFDKIGFGNQARIVGTKRVELVDFIQNERREAQIEMGESLRMEEKEFFFGMKPLRPFNETEVWNKAVKKLNKAIDKYLEGV